MGVDPWHDWNAHYEVLPGKEKVVSELKQLAEKADHIYLATDLDREGEAIAWHLRKSSAAMNSVTAAWCSMRSPKTLFVRPLKSRAN